MQALQTSALLPELGGVALAELPVPQAGPGEVLVRVRAATVGFPDLLMTHGGYQTKPDLPFVGGMEVAGEIAATGAGVEHLHIGDAVIASRKGGGFADYNVYPAASVFAKPAGLSFAQAAGLVSAYLTAYVALVRCARIEAGEWLLVHGAAGGVGLAAVDLGKALGARVIATASSKIKLDTIAAEYAPDALIEGGTGFREQVKAIAKGGADVVFDPIGGDTFTESTRCIAFGGRLLVIGFTSGEAATLPTNIALIKGFSVLGIRAGEYGRRFPERGQENLAAIRALAAEGRIHPRVYAEIPLKQWREAFAMLTKREVIGRVVLVPGD